MSLDEDSFRGRVTGVVERVSTYARGVIVKVSFHANRYDKYPSVVTVWADLDAPLVGTRVCVTGDVSWIVEEYEGRHLARVSFNRPTWEVLAAPAAAVAPVVAVADSDDTPF